MSNEEQLSLGSQAGKTEFGTGRVTEWMVREAWWRPKQGRKSHWGREGLRPGGVWFGMRFTHRENGNNIRTGWWEQTMPPMMNRGAYLSTMRGAGISFKSGMHNLVQGQNVLQRGSLQIQRGRTSEVIRKRQISTRTCIIPRSENEGWGDVFTSTVSSRPRENREGSRYQRWVLKTTSQLEAKGVRLCTAGVGRTVARAV